VIAGTPEVSKGKSERSQLFSFGQIGDAPVVFEVIVVPLSGELAEDEVDAFMEQARKSLEEHAPKDFVRKGPAKRVTVGHHPAALVEHTVNGLETQTYLEVQGSFEVFVRGYANHKERPSSWAGVEEKVAGTLAGGGAAAL
jgi:hypothetical protein